MAAAKKVTVNTAYLEQQADVVREALAGTLRQEEVFRAAAEAGYLTALADGTEDAEERQALVAALETLSKATVIEWEVEGFLAEAWEKISVEGNEARCAAVGARLKELGQAEAGLLIGAIVAQASNGIDKSEAKVLERIGAAAGLERPAVAGVVKRARGG
jgi:tellurite resistance protein